MIYILETASFAVLIMIAVINEHHYIGTVCKQMRFDYVDTRTCT